MNQVVVECRNGVIEMRRILRFEKLSFIGGFSMSGVVDAANAAANLLTLHYDQLSDPRWWRR
jgi:hypothetical protein